jgi:hypothetical protein
MKLLGQYSAFPKNTPQQDCLAMSRKRKKEGQTDSLNKDTSLSSTTISHTPDIPLGKANPKRPLNTY